jgi:DNA-binding PadR family transcriptional regulator
MRVTNREWIRDGGQKGALALVLRKPMTPTEILAAMRKLCPKAQIRDIWLLLRKFEARQLVVCLTPGELNGRFYFLTNGGRNAVKRAFGLAVRPLPGRVNWKKYTSVVRAKVRKLVLAEVAGPWRNIQEKKTASAIRKAVRGKHPLGLSATIRALRDLERSGLVCRAGTTDKRNCSYYRITLTGKRIVEQFFKQDQYSDDHLRTIWQQCFLKKPAPIQHEKEKASSEGGRLRDCEGTSFEIEGNRSKTGRDPD